MLFARRSAHVIFDLDGVLLDTEPLYTRATQEIVGEFGKVFDWSVKGDMIGRSAIDGARHLVAALGVPLAPEEYLTRRKPILDALFPIAEPIAGARELVAQLAEKRLPLAVATSSDAYQFRLKTSRHDWFSVFGTIVCGDDPRIAKLKPAPDIFLVTAEALGARPEDCLVFEDSLAGVAAARAAGMQVVALPDPNMDAGRYGDAHVVLSSFADLVLSDVGL